MWFYSHKLSKILIINNLTFVGLTLYPFFGLLVYYRTFSLKVFLMAAFLFLMLLIIDVIKDFLTRTADKMFGYDTIPIFFGLKTSRIISIILIVISMGVSAIIIDKTGFNSILNYYFGAGLFILILSVYLLMRTATKNTVIVLNILRIWIFIGIIAMLFNGILTKF
jgi:4-hydroxybenzoate polyprenyltransferase